MKENEIKKPKGFLWMDEWAELTAEFTNEQLGILLKAVQAFHLGNDYDIGKDKELRVAFRFITACIKANDEKYERACKLKAEAGKRGRAKQLGQMPTNAGISQDMPTNAGYQNTNSNENINTNPNTNPNENKTPLKKGEGETRPPAGGFSPFEIFGKFQNVQLFADQYRTLCMTYGQEATDGTIEDLSAKLADGSKQSANHYATLDYWLRLHKAGGYDVPMSSNDTDPEEARLRSLWEYASEEERAEYLRDNNGKDPMQVYKEGKEKKQ